MPKLSLDWHLARAERQGNYQFIDEIADLRWNLYQAFKVCDWPLYNSYARQLNEHGASISLHPVPPEFPQEQTQMGMFDKPIYLTGKNGEGYVEPGDKFWLHNCRIAGQVNLGNGPKDQAKLLVSRERDGEKTVVYSAGAAIVNQVKRMDNNDRASMPIEVRLDTVNTGKGNAANVMTPADQPAPDSGEDFTSENGVTDF